MFDIEWDTLKKINSKKIINSMYIWIFFVPILMKVFELVNANAYTFIIFDVPITIQLELPFSLILFYFSAIFFAIGNLIITFTCPLIIRENDSFSDFQNDGKKLKQLQPYVDDISFNWGKLANEIEQKIQRQYKTYSKVPFTSQTIEQTIEQDLKKEDPKNYFWEIYDEAKKGRKNFRLSTSIFYILGFGLMSIVLLQNLYFVLSVLYKQYY